MREEFDCDFERLDGYLFVPPANLQEELEREVKAAHRAGITDGEQVKRAPIDSYDTGMCLRIARQAQFHPLKYLTGLSHAIERDGGRIFTRPHASNMEGGAPVRVETSDGYVITADAIVIATNTLVNDIVTIHAKQAYYTTYVIGAGIPRDSVAKAPYCDPDDSYHYVRVVQNTSSKDGDQYDILMVGGEDHISGQENDGGGRHSRLEAWGRERFPMMEGIELRWSGQVMWPVDGLTFTGRHPGDPRNVYIPTGDAGMGMTHGTIAGILITDLIMKRECSWVPLYKPSRKTIRASLRLAMENINVVAQYVEDHFSGGDIDSPEEIAQGESAIIRRGMSKLAGYRDEQGNYMKALPGVRTLGALLAGIAWKRFGIAPVTAHVLMAMAGSLPVRRTVTLQGHNRNSRGYGREITRVKRGHNRRENRHWYIVAGDLRPHSYRQYKPVSPIGNGIMEVSFP